jgi:NADPH:quinone reductase-like Zn-dependent oxidoreductase
MKAMGTNAGIDELQILDVPLPEPSPGEVRIRVRASALNPADQKVLGGEFLGNILHGKQRPIVTGYDFVGPVEAVGSGVDFAVGDEVFGFLPYGRRTRRGAFAESVIASSASIARRPASLSAADACAISTAGVTALQCLRDIGHVKSGQRVLVVGASGGVGSLAIGVAARLGAVVTGVCSKGAVDFVRSLGAASVIIRGEVDPLADNQRYDVILDTAAAYSFFAMRHLLLPRGIFISTLPSPSLLLSMALAPLLGKRAAFVMVASRRTDLEQLAAWATEGMTVPIDSTFAVRDLNKALARLAKGGMKGKVVVSVDGGFAV